MIIPNKSAEKAQVSDADAHFDQFFISLRHFSIGSSSNSSDGRREEKKICI